MYLIYWSGPPTIGSIVQSSEWDILPQQIETSKLCSKSFSFSSFCYYLCCGLFIKCLENFNNFWEKSRHFVPRDVEMKHHKIWYFWHSQLEANDASFDWKIPVKSPVGNCYGDDAWKMPTFMVSEIYQSLVFHGAWWNSSVN